MRLHATVDVPRPVLDEFVRQCGPGLAVDVDEGRMAYRSADPPSWVALLAEADLWQQALGGAAVLFAAEVIKEAAKESWRHRAKAVSAVATGTTHVLERLGQALAALRTTVPARTAIHLGLPVPDAVFSTSLTLEGSDSEQLAVQAALFVGHLPALGALMEREAVKECAMTGVFLTLLDDGSMQVAWYDRATMERIEHVLPR